MQTLAGDTRSQASRAQGRPLEVGKLFAGAFGRARADEGGGVQKWAHRLCRSFAGLVMRPLNTPGQDRTGDLQRVRLTS